MSKVYTAEVAETFNARGDAFRDRLNGIVAKHGLPMTVMGMGTILDVHTCEGPIRSERDTERGNPLKDKLLFYDLLARGHRMTWRNSMLLCLPITDDDLASFAGAFDEVLGARAHLLAAE
jgi:glutamate-1-semialdehyde 2,1-aminomutase